MTREQIDAELLKPLSSNDVSEREGPGNTRLSYVDGHYVIRKLVELYGPHGYEVHTTACEHLSTETNERGVHSVTYSARVSLSVYADDGAKRVVCSRDDIGFGIASGKRIGEAHEQAAKTAVTDALKRAARYLGPKMGLALYDKERREVSDDASAESFHASEAGASVELAESQAMVLIDAIERAASQVELDDLRKRGASVYRQVGAEAQALIKAASDKAKRRLA